MSRQSFAYVKNVSQESQRQHKQMSIGKTQLKCENCRKKTVISHAIKLFESYLNSIKVNFLCSICLDQISNYQTGLLTSIQAWRYSMSSIRTKSRQWYMTSKLFPSVWNLDHQVDQLSALEIRCFSTTCVEFITPTAQPCV